VGLEGADVAVEGAHRREHQRLPGEIAGIADQVARGEIVRAVGNDVIARDDRKRVAGIEALIVGLDLYMRVEPRYGLARALDLGEPHPRRIVHDLPLQVVQRYAVVIDDAERADAGRRQVHEHRRAEPAGANHQHPGRLQLLLALAADLAQHQMPLVAFDLR
jgi:hypothetical protein